MQARRSRVASVMLSSIPTGARLVLRPHDAAIQDRDGAGPVLKASRRLFPFIERVFANSGYAGEKVASASCIFVEIVRAWL